MRVLLATVLVTLAPCIHAADLGSENAIWGPLSTAPAPIDDGTWFAQAMVVGAAGDRCDGMFITERASGVDVQLVGGFAFDAARWDSGNQRNNWEPYFRTYRNDWGRAYVRGGTDPLADDPGSPFGVVGGALCLPYFLSVQGEAGYSHERALIASAEASFLCVRVRLERDRLVDTVRVGTGPRILGTTGPWAGGVLLDWARSYMEAGDERVSEEGGIFSAFVLWRPYNHLIIGTQVQVTTGAVERDHPFAHERTVVEGAMTVGVSF